jgi:hypothetical protein
MILVDPMLVFIEAYNNRVPNWKKITRTILGKDKNLVKILKSTSRFIQKNNLEPKKLVDAIIDHYYKKNKRYPTIFLFSDYNALSIYNSYTLAYEVDLTKEQEIRISVKKSVLKVKNLQEFGINISEGLMSLSETGKGDPYFLLAYGIRKNVPDACIALWDKDDEIKKIVLDEIFKNKA